MSPFLRLSQNDLVRGAITAATTAMLGALYTYVNAGDFSIFSADWHAIGTTALDAGVVALFGYLTKNLLTTEEGNFLGVKVY